MKDRNLLSRAPMLCLVVLAACDGGDGDGGRTAEPRVTGIRAVSGSGQHAQVRGAAPGNAAVVGGEPVLDAPLVAQLVVQSGASATLLELTGPGAGPSMQETPLPQGWSVNWETVPAGCGRGLVGVTNIEDDEGHSTNRQVVGTRAGTCATRAVAVKAGQPVFSDSFTFVLTPGPAAAGRVFEGPRGTAYTGSVILPPLAVQDAHGNAVPFRATTQPGDSLVSVQDTTWGTVGARTLTYVNTTGWPAVQRGTFFLVDSAGARIARVDYQIPNGVAAFAYTSYSGVVD